MKDQQLAISRWTYVMCTSTSTSLARASHVVLPILPSGVCSWKVQISPCAYFPQNAW